MSWGYTETTQDRGSGKEVGVRRDEEKRGEKKERDYGWPKLQFKQTVPESGRGVTRQDYLAIVPKN